MPDLKAHLLFKDLDLNKFYGPCDLTSDFIRKLGSTYLQLRKQNRKGCFGFFDALAHNNLAIANQLAEFQDCQDPYEMWLFLANIYRRLPNENGQIATAIKTLFEIAFGQIPLPTKLIHKSSNINETRVGFNMDDAADTLVVTINNHYMDELPKTRATSAVTDTFLETTHLHTLAGHPERLSNAIIQNIGVEYLKKHDQQECGFFAFFQRLMHKNQPVAKRLKQYCSASTAYEKWLFLADNYAGLTDSHGELSDAILKLFAAAFKQTPYTAHIEYSVSRYVDHQHTAYYSPQTIAVSLRNIVNNYYYPRYREIELLQAQTSGLMNRAHH